MDKVYQVFVSSTFSDLEDERKHVSEKLAKAGYIPAGMELFPATDMKQFEYIKRIIDRSDYYVVIVAGRYGSLADDGKSFTEKEYEYAVSKGIPVLAFLHAHPEKIEVGKTDQDQHKSRKLLKFRERLLKDGRMVDFWSDRNDLCTNVLSSVVQSVNLTPGVGWVRGDQAIDPKLLQDFERLRRDNEELKKQLSELNTSEITFPSDLPSPDDPIELASPDDPRKLCTTWKDVFLAASNDILAERHEGTIVYEAVQKLPNLPRRYFTVADDDVVKLRYQFEALGLIRAISKTFSNGNTHVAWSITDKGRRYLIQQKAIKREKEG